MFSRLYLIIFAIGIAFLPFTRALTIDAGAPIKIYELIFSLAIFSFFLNGFPIERSILRRYLLPLGLFLAAAVVSYILAILSDNRSSFSFRGGAELDGLARLVYLAVNIFTLAMSFKLTMRYPRSVMWIWLTGTTLSVAYMIYATASLTLTNEAYLLPGLDRHQIGNFGPIIISRSGTFEEGNFGGFYFLFSVVIAFMAGQPLMMGIALIGLILTKSTSAYFGLIVLMGTYIMLDRRVRALAIPIVAVVAAAGYAIFNLFAQEGKFETDNSSSAVRINEVMTAFEMFKEHVLFGVGLGQYGFRYGLYRWNPAVDALTTSERHITNNIYAELMAETGLIGCILFGLFWWNWMSQARGLIRVNPLFFSTGIAIMVVWLAYPTFNIAFLWAFLGFAIAMMNRTAHRLPTPASPACGAPTIPTQRTRS